MTQSLALVPSVEESCYGESLLFPSGYLRRPEKDSRIGKVRRTGE